MYEFNLPTKIIFGIDSINFLGEEAQRNGKVALLVTGKKSVRESGILGLVEKVCAGKVELVLYEGVLPEPDIEVIDRGIKLGQQKKCDVVIGLGGGTVLDTAKAIAGLMKEKEGCSVREYLEGEGAKRITMPGMPFLALPTTAGTGSEVTNNAVVVNRKLKRKRSFRSPYLFSKVAIIDPNLTLSCPKKVTAFSGMDALVHLVEGCISKKSNGFTDTLALRGIKLIGRRLVHVYKEGDDLSAREDMCQASLFGGVLIANSGLGIAHGISAFLGALYDIPHGLVNAVLLPFVMEFNFSACPWKFKNIAFALGEKIDEVSREEGANEAIEAVREIQKELEIPQRLKDLGIEYKDLPIVASKSLDSSSTKKNPREVNYELLLELLKTAY